VRQQGQTGGGRRDAAGAACEQPGAELVLQRADRRREAGLRDAAQRGGAGELLLLGERDDVLQLPQIH
jgi:hypothetical protein